MTISSRHIRSVTSKFGKTSSSPWLCMIVNMNTSLLAWPSFLRLSFVRASSSIGLINAEKLINSCSRELSKSAGYLAMRISQHCRRSSGQEAKHIAYVFVSVLSFRYFPFELAQDEMEYIALQQFFCRETTIHISFLGKSLLFCSITVFTRKCLGRFFEVIKLAIQCFKICLQGSQNVDSGVQIEL